MKRKGLKRDDETLVGGLEVCYGQCKVHPA